MSASHHPNHFIFDALDFHVEAYGEKGVRKVMEDEHLICPSLRGVFKNLQPERDAALIGIFDGHGGKETVIKVKSHIAEEVALQISLLTEEDATMPLSDKIVAKVFNEAYQNMDSRISTEIPNCKDGSTAIVMFIQSKTVYSITLGDAAAFLGIAVDTQLHAVPLSDVHKPWILAEKQRILNSGGTVENGRVNGTLEVTRSFGDLKLKRYGIHYLPTFMKFSLNMNEDPFIVMGCDGFWSSWTALEALQKTKTLMKKEENRLSQTDCCPPHFNLKSICKDLVECVLVEKKSIDNISVIVVRVQSC